MTYSTGQVAAATGASYRQLDYWVSNGVLTPAVAPSNGSGQPRRFSDGDLERAKVLRAVAQLGATSPILARIAQALPGEDVSVWPLLLFVLVDGTVCEQIVPGAACYVVDVGGLCAAGYKRRRVHAPAA